MIGKQKKVILAGAIGNALEWYDFTIYAFFVPIIASQFFPNKDRLTSLLATFGVFAVGFLARPFGAILFGYIGDHAGRKKALVLSMMMMSFPTFFIGILPNHQAIGILAPLILIGLRIIQGLAVSGELTTATVFLIEHADQNKRGFAGSLAMAGALLGMVFSSVLATLIDLALNDAQLAAWGWRIPFLLGGLIGIMGLIIRLRAVDPEMYETARAQNKLKPQRVSVKQHISSLNYSTILIGIFLTSIMAIANYFLIAYFNTFLVEIQGLALRPVMLINTLAISIQVITTIFMGKLSDAIGRQRVLASGMISLAILAQPIFWLFTQQNIYFAFFGEIMFALASGALTGVIPTLLAEMFDTYHRNMGISLSYNLALALFGGTVPIVAMTLVAYTHNIYVPAWYLMAFSILALITLLVFFNKNMRTIAPNQSL